MVWLCTNVASAPWSRSGSKGLDTMTWSSTDSTWRDSNSLLHMSLSTCSETWEIQVWDGRRGSELTEKWVHPCMSWSLFTTEIHWSHQFVWLQSLHPRLVLNLWRHMLQLWTEKTPINVLFFCFFLTFNFFFSLCWQLHIVKVCEWHQ